MTHPLTRWHRFLREVACYLLGHQWETSSRSRDDRADVERRYDTALTYREKRSGNPFLWYSASWQWKCRRCRERVRDAVAWQPWYAALWAIVRQVWTDFWWRTTWAHPWKRDKPGATFFRTPVRWWLATMVSGLMHGLGVGLWISQDRFHWPVSWLIGLLLDADHWIEGHVEKHLTTYRWQKPQNPSDPHEMGFWRIETRGSPVGPESIRVWTYNGGGYSYAEPVEAPR